jgi:hypothetical protein
LDGPSRTFCKTRKGHEKIVLDVNREVAIEKGLSKRIIQNSKATITCILHLEKYIIGCIL